MAALETIVGRVAPGVANEMGANVDVLFQGPDAGGASLPPTVILDYVYGVAAYQRWHSKRGDILDVMDSYREEHYAQIQPLPPAPRDSDDSDATFQPDNTDSEYVPGDTSGSDSPTDSDYKLPELGERYTSTRRRDESDLSKAMDELNMVLMYVTRGITPKEAAERRQTEIEEEERAAQEASRNKVMEWKNHMDVC